MNDKTIIIIRQLRISMIVLLIFAGSIANGQYEINWSTIEGDGRCSSGGPYTLTDTIG